MPAIPYAGELAALATACCWTVTSMAFEAAGKRIGSLPVNFIRLVMALGFLTVWGAIARGMPLPTDATASAWGWLAISGVVGFAVGDLCLFRAFVVVGARLSMLMMALVPLFTALIGRAILGEQLGLLDLAGMGLTMGGVAWVVLERKKSGEGDGARPPVSGILLGFGGAVGQAVGLVLSKYGMRDYDPFAATQIRVIAGIGAFAAIFTIAGIWPRVVEALSNRAAMVRTALGAVFGPFLGVSMSLLAVKHTETGVAATIMSIVPVLIIAPSALIFKEPVTLRAVLGALIAVGGVAVLFL
ncbi:MAG: DMT family transporter [Deltaproteobacteria bacterium]|nr:DMT family transporter [Deltaproteobacteria bacterium]